MIQISSVSKIINSIIASVKNHTLVFVVSAIITIGITTPIAHALLPKQPRTITKQTHVKTPVETPTPPISTPSAEITPTTSDVLGDSDSLGLDNLDDYDYPPPLVIPTLPPYVAPTYTPQIFPTTSWSSPPTVTSCEGIPTAYNSEAIVSATTVLVNETATIEIQLLDCKNNFASVNDTLTITSSDGNVKINGNSSPVTVQTQNGKNTFSVSSTTATTTTITITNTTRSFTVTDPHNHNPTITFANNTSGSSNCTTGAGVPNGWFSNVYPNPPLSTTTGSMDLVVIVKDCNRNPAPVSDMIKISLISGDPYTKLNGNNLPATVTTQNGQANFTITSQVNGSVRLRIEDSTSGFTVTDPNDNNPSITFSTPTSSTPTPTSAPAATNTPTPGSITPTSNPAPTNTSSPLPTNTTAPASSATPT